MTLPTRPAHRTVDRILHILEIAAREPRGATLTEVAQRLEAPVSSIQVLVNGLVAANFLVERDRRFSLGPTPFVLNMIAGNRPITSVRHADLEELADQAHQNTVLGIAIKNRLVYIDHADRGPEGLAYPAVAHVWRPLIRTASGRVLLAFSDRREIFSYLDTLGPEEQPLIDGFIEEIDQIRSTGMAMSHGYMGADRSAVAVPILEDGVPVAAVAVVGLSTEVESKLAGLGDLLRDHARRWSRRNA